MATILNSKEKLLEFISRETPLAQLGQPVTRYMIDILTTMTETVLALGGTSNTGGGSRNFLLNPLMTTEMADRAVTNIKLGLNAVRDTNILDGAITNSKLGASSVRASNIQTGAVIAGKIGANAVTSTQIQDGAITSAKIGNLQVGAAQLADGSVGVTKLANNSVNSVKIQDGVIISSKIQDGAVNSQKLANNSVAAINIIDGSVGSDELASGAVDADALASNAVVSSKIQNLAVTGDKVADLAITSGKIASNAVVNSKIANDAVTATKISTGAVGLDALGLTATGNAGRFLGINQGETGIALLTAGTGGTTVQPANQFIGFELDYRELPIARTAAGVYSLDGFPPYNFSLRDSDGNRSALTSLTFNQFVTSSAGVRTSIGAVTVTSSNANATISNETVNFNSVASTNITLVGGNLSVVIGIARDANGFSITSFSATTSSGTPTFDYLGLDLGFLWGSVSQSLKLGFRANYVNEATTPVEPQTSQYILFQQSGMTAPTEGGINFFSTQQDNSFSTLPIRRILPNNNGYLIIAHNDTINELHVSILSAGDTADDIIVTGAFNRYRANEEVTVGAYKVFIIDITFEIGRLVSGQSIGIGIS